MRSAPSPALQNVLVARPGQSSNSTAVIRRDDLLAAAVLAADEREPRRRSVLSRVTRRWSKFSDSLRRRRGSSTPASQAAAALAATDAPFRAIQRAEVVAAFDRERARQPTEEEEREEREEMAVSSMRETSTRRVRQVGARDDDDTLLMLPRVASVSFSTPDSPTAVQRSSTPRVRQLPRVSALMPVRAPRPLATASPVSSSSGRRSGGRSSRDESEGSFSDHFEDREENALGDEDDDEMGIRRAIHRLPTGMTNTDVEIAMESAVVEIASDGDSDTASEQEGESRIEQNEDTGQSGEGSAGEVRIETSFRTRSEVPQNRPRETKDDSQISAAFSRRTTSSTHTFGNRRMFSEDDVRQTANADPKARLYKSQDFSLFEDDYLSFQGFHGQPENRFNYQTMSALLRARRISSITDSHSEESDEGSAEKSGDRPDTHRRPTKRNSVLSSMFWQKRGIPEEAL